MKSQQTPYIKHLFVCTNQREEGKTCCGVGREDSAEQIKEKLKSFASAHGLKGKVRISSSGCMDLCEQGPNVMVYPDGRWYSGVTLETVDRIIEEQLRPLVLREPQDERYGETQMNGAQHGIEVFLFDLGNVFVTFDHTIAAKKVAEHSNATSEDLFKLFFDSPLVIDHDTGRISTHEFYEQVRKAIRLSLSYEQFLEVWNRIFIENVEMSAFARRLLGKYPCYLISNTNRPHFEFCLKEYPILREMTGHILSYEVGQLKPHPAIYQKALELAGVPASRIFYIDDRSDLVDAARSMGFQAHRFTALQPLLEDLRNRGFIDTIPQLG